MFPATARTECRTETRPLTKVAGDMIAKLTPVLEVALLFLTLVSFGQPACAQQATEAPAAAASAGADHAADGSPSSDFDSSFGNRLGGIVRTIGQDERHFVMAPFQRKAIVWDVLFVGATTALVSTDERVLHSVPASWHEINRNISNGAVVGTVAIPTAIYLTGLIDKSKSAQETGIRTAEATADSVIMYGILKVITARQRPFTGEGEGKFFAGNWKNSSFPSGHSMLSWTIASTVAHRYHSLPLDIMMYGLATTVSTTRVTAGQHFPSDVFVGSVLGYLIGDYVAHKNESGFPVRSGKCGWIQNAILQHVSIGD